MNHTRALLIVGGGPVGLSAALLASRYGIPCTLVERYEAPYRHPKARGVRTRGMELFRLWGLEEEIRAAAPHDPEYGFIYCETLLGREFGRTPAGNAEAGQSPTGDCRVPQDQLEWALRRRVSRTAGIETLFGTALETIEQDADGVRATLVETRTGERRTLAADYVVAADGAAGTVRAALGIEQDGETLGYWQSVYWHGEIADAVAGRTAIQYLTADPGGGFVTVAPVDGRERWMTFRMRGHDRQTDPGVLGEEQARELIRTAVGREVPAEIISTATYQVAAKVARRYRDGRVFLAGDAAHSFPPTGGFGLNTGVQDAHNLLWKLALVMRGASPALLDTYELERRPIAESNAKWSAENAARFDAVWERLSSGAPAGDPIVRQKAHLLAVQRDLGFRYTTDGLAPDAVVGEVEAGRADLTAQVGRRAPHLWVSTGKSDGDGDGRRSTLELFEGDFTVLHGVRGPQWADAARALAAHVALPVNAFAVGSAQFAVDADRFAELYRLADDAAVLIRPDGHVAWRSSPGEAQDADAALLQAFAALLRDGEFGTVGSRTALT